jgi:hypothetical protein
MIVCATAPAALHGFWGLRDQPLAAVPCLSANLAHQLGALDFAALHVGCHVCLLHLLAGSVVTPLPHR